MQYGQSSIPGLTNGHSEAQVDRIAIIAIVPTSIKSRTHHFRWSTV